jgi:hypothetical protein
MGLKSMMNNFKLVVSIIYSPFHPVQQIADLKHDLWDRLMQGRSIPETGVGKGEPMDCF